MCWTLDRSAAVSLDYPFYEQLVRRRHRAARWWLVGDRLYYLGLIPALAAFAGIVAAIVAGLLGFGWGWLGVAAVCFVAGAVVFVIGGSLKGHAYELARRDAITP
jgi:hypothetical protein